MRPSAKLCGGEADRRVVTPSIRRRETAGRAPVVRIESLTELPRISPAQLYEIAVARELRGQMIRGALAFTDELGRDRFAVFV